MEQNVISLLVKLSSIKLNNCALLYKHAVFIKKYEITDNWIASKSGWTPYDNLEVKGMPIITIVNGKVVMRDNEIINESCGEKVEFIY